MATATPSTTRKTASRKTSASRTGARDKDAVQLLKADHREVETLFAQFEKARGEDRKAKLAGEICNALKVHTQIEEEIFYPASREWVKDEEIVDEAIVEHASAKELIAQIEAGDAADEMWEAKVKVLQEMIEHHVGEEEKEYFPQLQKTEMDLAGIGRRMKARKEELMMRMGGAPRH